MSATTRMSGRSRPRRAKALVTPKSKSKSPRARRTHKWLRRFFIGATITLLLVVAGVAGAIAWAWNTMELPDTKPLAQTTFIKDANGNQLASFAAENRVEVPISDVPEVVRVAVLDTEDHDYYKHHGVDPRGVTRALWHDVRNETTQGGSTITQQYVKLTYTGSQRTFTRKFQEAILAMKLDRKYSKDEILERYLNTIYFGRGAYGVQTASRSYFGKDVQQLGLREASYLAGLIRAPELADAYAAPDTAKQRRDATLDRMVHYGSAGAAEVATVKQQPLQSYVVKKAQATGSVTSSAKGGQYFVDYVRRQLILRYGEEKVLSGGLQVTTTLDQTMQTQAYNSVYGTLGSNDPAGALVSLDQDGRIKAMVGGRDWSQSQVNLAVGSAGGGSGRQAGSTFKPLALAAALEEGATLNDTYSGAGHMTLKLPNKTTWNVSNYGNEPFGSISLTEATVHSVNTVYAQVAEDLGPTKMVDTAKALGITSKLDPVYALVLGTSSVSPLEMADAYLTFSQRGVHVAPSAIVEVKDAKGNRLEKNEPQRKRVISTQTADQVNYALQQVMQRGTGTRAQIGKPAAGKTGTTEDSADAWFVGYTPSLSTALWMGWPESEEHKLTNVHGIGAVTGGTLPAQMWSTYMRQATSTAEATPFQTSSIPKSTRTTDSVVSSTTSTSVAGGSTTTSDVPKTTTTTAPVNTTTTLHPSITITVPDPSGGGHGGHNDPRPPRRGQDE
jgi:penicillin-binding protein 1A